MISKCSLLLLATQRNALSIFCKHASSASTKIGIRFDDKKVIVTGAGKGIGRTLVLKLADAGANVVAISRTQSVLEYLRNENPKIQTLCLDIRKFHDTKSAIMDLGPVDLLVNVGITDAKELRRKHRKVTRLLSVNVKAIIDMTWLIADKMKVRGQGGSIVNIFSVIRERVPPYPSAYGVSKADVMYLTRCLAVEYGPHNIRVNSVSPTVARTVIAERAGMFDSSTWFVEPDLRTYLERITVLHDIVAPVFSLLSEHTAKITGLSVFVN